MKIGYLRLTRYDREKIKLADVFVDENYRNIGIGSKLLDEAIKLALLLEVKLIYGVICGETKRLEIFYRKFGFEISGKNIELKLRKND